MQKQGPHSGSYLEFLFAESPVTIMDTFREDSRFNDVHGDEL